ncbi:MAG: hypothetical protein KYX69_19715 [Sphingomonas sp.]|uniref:hypothetical protein n=1 Tax=Sphingomonas sp. TaxID=28214 RepID=UPI0026246AA3|nr:hypothetical protein [Sphingomonas sp.]MDK2769932.1 hypothetical protein [Sphingomonas sp.]
MSDELKTPEFARIEIKMSGKTGLRKAAQELRGLADKLEAIGKESMPDATSDFLAWGSIKAVSQKLRAGA